MFKSMQRIRKQRKETDDHISPFFFIPSSLVPAYLAKPLSKIKVLSATAITPAEVWPSHFSHPGLWQKTLPAVRSTQAQCCCCTILITAVIFIAIFP